jgi:sortase (surface protein transpeptidase)
VRIPSIGVNAAVDLLGLNADGTVQVPSAPDDAGWYRGSAAPGLPGAAVLLGHVDFASTGPAVFYRLGEVKPGAAVLVTRKDGTTATFTADAVREFPKDAFPTDEVYGPTDGDAELRLITCGSWDPDQHEYVGNTVVFATLDPPASPGSAPAARVPAARKHPQPR